MHTKVKSRAIAAARTITVFIITLILMQSFAVTSFAKNKSKETLAEKFTGAVSNGYSTHGWEKKYKNGYWGMYGGHNCTSYAAYMLQLNGTPEITGLGHANQWDNNAKKKGYSVDKTPAVGSIAQTDRGATGHVMYVEAVAEDKSWIIISEDNWEGEFNWEKHYLPENGVWNYNFIHINDLKPVTIEDGWYVISRKGKNNPETGNPLCLDVPDYSWEWNKQLQQYEYWTHEDGSPNNGENQQFYFDKLWDGTYSIRAFNGLVLDINGSSIVQNPWNKDGLDQAGQHWNIYSDGDGYYKIMSNWNGKCIDISGNNNGNYINVISYQDNATSAQRFKLIPVPEK